MVERIITVFVNPKQVILANDKTLMADENGVIELRVDELLVSEEKGIQEYDRVISDLISHGQRLSLYFMFLNSSRFGVSDTVTMLGVDREIGKQLLDLGMRYHILRKVDTQKKLITDVREQVRTYMNVLKRSQILPPVASTVPLGEKNMTEEAQPLEEPKKVTLRKQLPIPKKKGK